MSEIHNTYKAIDSHLEEKLGAEHWSKVKMYTIIGFVVILLVVLALIYWIYVLKKDAAKAKASVDKFLGRYNNHNMGGNSPLWQYGNMHAGMGGSIDSPVTAYQASLIYPEWRADGTSPYILAPTPVRVPVVKESLTSGPLQYRCGESWDPSAISELQAQYSLEGITGESNRYGEAALQLSAGTKIDGTNSMLTDEQLNRIMSGGGVP